LDIRLSRARQVIGEATDILVGTGTLRERLDRAAKVILAFEKHDLDGFPDLQASYSDIYQTLTRVQDDRLGSFAATVEKMSGPAMKKLAEAILALDRATRTT
jgi:hypothetical protein